MVRLSLGLPGSPLPLTRPRRADVATSFRRVALVVNPAKSGWEQARDAVLEAAADAGWPRPHVARTSVDEPGGPQATRAVADGADLVVVGGGDGTVREAARGLLGTGIPLGVVPLGTANIFARNLLLSPRALRRNVITALHGSTATVDVGAARFRQHSDPDHGWSSEHLFLVLAGIGHDGATVLRTRPWLKDRVGWLAYAESGLRHALRRPVRMEVGDGSHVRVVAAWSVVVGNCGRVPVDIVVFPDAAIDDGLLETLEVTVRMPREWVPVAAKGLLRLRRDVPGLRYGRASSLTVRPERPVAVQLDGDGFPEVHEVRFALHPAALTVKVPPSAPDLTGSAP